MYACRIDRSDIASRETLGEREQWIGEDEEEPPSDGPALAQSDRLHMALMGYRTVRTVRRNPAHEVHVRTSESEGSGMNEISKNMTVISRKRLNELK
jgi:hypothetical protein